MKVHEIVEQLDLEILSGEGNLDREVSCGYCCDLLSLVMSNGTEEHIWITVQTHMNVVAIATLLDIPCIILPEGIKMEKEVLDKAEKEEVVILSSELTSYELSGKLYKMGIGRQS